MEKEILTPDNQPVLLEQVRKEVLQALPKREFSVEHIAERLGIMPRTFSRRIKLLTGSTPKDIICSIQMQKACKMLLEEPELKISYIASACGFNEPSSFTHTFIRVYGINPSEYRHQHKS